jgi:alkyl hydroperoxide reductase subunit D
VVREKGATEELVLAVVRVAAVIHAIGAVVDSVPVEVPEPAIA